MVDVSITLDDNDILQHIKTSGHSGYGCKGDDIVCAAVSTLIGSSYIMTKRLLDENTVLIRNEDAESENVLEYRIKSYPTHLAEVLRGATLLMLTGLTEIHNKYKEYIRLEIKNNE